MEVIYKRYLKHILINSRDDRQNKMKIDSSAPSLTTLLIIFESWNIFYHYD
jgi:hypothetical protein